MALLGRISEGEIDVMEMEIAIQDYVNVILGHWKVVLVVFVLATMVATVASFLQPPTYEASVALLEESYEFFTAPRVASLERAPVKLYPTLARTATVEDRVIEALESSLSRAEKTPGVLLSMVTIQEDADSPALFQIKVRADESAKAVQIANTWAEQYVQVASSLEAPWHGELEIIEQNLESADQALSDFKERTGLGLISDPGADEAFIVLGPWGLEFERKALQLAEHRQAHDSVRLLLQSAQQAKEAGGEIRDLPLQLLNVPVIVDRGQLSADVVSRLGDLDALIALLQAEEELISEVADQLSTAVDQLQKEIGEAQLELGRLSRARGLELEAYTALASKLQEAELYRSRTQILSPATRSRLVGSNRKLGIALGAGLGLAGGVLAAFGVEYLQRIRERASEKSLEAESH